MKKIYTCIVLVIVCMFAISAARAATITMSKTSWNAGEIKLGNTATTEVEIKTSGLTAPLTVSNSANGLVYAELSAPKEDVGYDTYILTLAIMPEEEGEACDYVIISGGDLDPIQFNITWKAIEDTGTVLPEHTVWELPYFESFDDADHYDGKSYLPKGWMSTGSVPFITAYDSSLPAVTGTYYMVAPESNETRNERAYTGFFNMKAGVTYTISFYVYQPGRMYSDVQRNTNLYLTVGTEQEASYHTATLYCIENTKIEKWTKCETQFTPKTDGEYCFSFYLTSDVNYAGYTAIDDLYITAPGLVMRPTAAMTISSWFDIMDSRLITFKGQPVKMTNLSTYATEYLWEVEGAIPSTSNEVNPEFLFENEGKYVIKLTAKNSAGSKTTYKEIEVEAIKEAKEGAGIMTYNPNDDKAFYNYSQIPTFETDKTYDFISGVNHYYHKMAERFVLPTDQELTISSLSTWLVAYSRMMNINQDERNQPFTISFYGETNGKLDENKLFGQKVSTVVDEFGSTGVGLEFNKAWGFDLSENPVTVKGTFYISFEFDDGMQIDSSDPNFVRTYLALGMMQHKSNQTSIYCKPTSGPEGAPIGDWCRLDEFDSSLKGYGLYLVLWCKIGDPSGTSTIAYTLDGKIAYAAQLMGEQLVVSGTVDNEIVNVYDMSGRVVAQAKTAAHSTSINVARLPKGMYIVNSSKGSLKFQK